MGNHDVARALLDRCREIGLRIRLAGERLHLERPAGPPPPALLDDLRSNRAAVVEYLTTARRARAHPCDCCGRFFYAEPAVVCYWCRPRGVTAAPATAPAPAPAPPPRCPGCGGGLHRTDPAGGPCWSCQRCETHHLEVSRG